MVMRYFVRLIVTLFCLISTLTFACPTFAQTPAPPVYPGVATPVSGAVQRDIGADYGLNVWEVSGPGVSANSSSVASQGGWSVIVKGTNFTITPPVGAPLGRYYVLYPNFSRKAIVAGDSTLVYDGPTAAFQVVAPPPTRPYAGMPAFSWQSTVAGVNTGNGNRTTVLPITGWTMRGGMKVSCALIHNSQGVLYGGYGDKWQASYFTYLSADGSGNQTVHWDNGLSYTFTSYGASFTAPYGIFDTLTAGGGSFTLTTSDQTRYVFGFVPGGGNAYLSAIIDLDGNTLTINHNPSTLISSVVDPTGRTLTYAYDGTGRLASITDPLNRTWGFSYDGGAGSGNLWYVTLPVLNGGGYADWFGYDGNHDIVAQQSPQGSATGATSTFGYNADSSLAWAKDPLGNQTTFAYNPVTTVITDPNGNATTHTYSAGELVSVTDALGKTSSTARDYNHIAVAMKDKRGNSSYFSSHFSNGTTKSTSTDSLNYSSSTSYDTNNKPVRSVDAVGNVTTTSYTGGDLRTTTVTSALNIPGTSAPFQATSKIDGYANGLPSTLTDANSYSSSVGYDGNGQPISVTDASNNTTKTFSTVLGWPLATGDALGHVTTKVYDNWGRATTTLFPDSTARPLYRLYYGGIHNFLTCDFYEAHSLVSSAGGMMVSVIGCVYPQSNQAPGLTPLFRLYGAAGDHIFTIDPGERDALVAHGYTLEGTVGYVRAQSAPGWQPLYRAWNPSSGQHLYTQDVSEFNALSPSWAREGVTFYLLSPSQAGSAVNTTYDLDGDVLTVTDADNHTVTNVYDGDDRMFQTTNGRGDVVKYGYDGSDPISGAPQRGLLSYKTDGNQHTTSYSYTVRNEPSATYYPDSTSESVTYGASGNVLTRTKADGSVIGYVYDADNRLTDITYPHMAATHFDYDADGRRTHMHDATGDTNWLYGDGLHLMQVTTPQGQVNYGYDLGSRRTTLYEGGVGTWVYQYYNNNLLYTLQSPIDGKTTWQYDPANRLTRKTKGNGDFETYAYDAAGQTTGIGYWFTDGVLARSLAYAYTPAGSIQTRAEGNRTTTYGYDGADQLTGEAVTGDYPYSLGYSYDGNGNRLTQTSNGGVSQQFTYDGHDKLTGGTAGGEVPGYDLNGSETSLRIYGSVYTMTYDDEDRLTRMTSPGATDTFTYNGLGLRVGKTDSTGTYAYVCDGTAPGAPVLSDGHALYNPGLSESRAGVLTYSDSDALGNLWTLDAASGDSTAGGCLYTAFGTPVLTTAGLATPFRYGGASGCQTDADIGLVLMGHCYYDTRIGRFLSQDPAGAGSNWYAYADNDPVNSADPLGLDAALGDFGLRPGDKYEVDPISAARAGMNVQLNQSSGLIAQFRYFEVDRVFYRGTTEIGRIELFEYAVPAGTSLVGNFNAARTSPLANVIPPGIGVLHVGMETYQSWLRGKYVWNHFRNKTVGDFKDKNFPGIGQPRPGTRLYQLADDGGNMNGGMSMEGLGLTSLATGKTGDIHMGLMTKTNWHDDPRGAAVLQVGWNYAWQLSNP